MTREGAMWCDFCGVELVSGERFTCRRCDPSASDWEWDDHVGETWFDPSQYVTFLIVGVDEEHPRDLNCVVLDSRPSLHPWVYEQGEIVRYTRSLFAPPGRSSFTRTTSRAEHEQMQRIT